MTVGVVGHSNMRAGSTIFQPTLAGHVVTSKREDKRAEFLIRVPSARLEALMDSVGTPGDVEMR